MEEKIIIALLEKEEVPNDIEFDLLVYSYHYESYEGSGFAAWRKDGKYYYHEMGHCSCDGPWDNVGSSAKVAVTLTDLKELAEKHYDNDAKNVVAYLESHV